MGLIYTARITYRGADRLDITRKGGDPVGLIFAPSWAILGPALAARKRAEAMRQAGDAAGADAVEQAAWDAYVPAYTVEMRGSCRRCPAAWKALRARQEVTLCCYCTDPARCHRTLLAGFLGRMGAEVLGERGRDDVS